MICTEIIKRDSRTRDVDYLVRTYSDKDMYIERDGILYWDAIDLPQFNYQYTETDVPHEKAE